MSSLSLRAGGGFVLRWWGAGFLWTVVAAAIGWSVSHGRSEQQSEPICYFAVYATWNRDGVRDAVAHGAVALPKLPKANGRQCC